MVNECYKSYISGAISGFFELIIVHPFDYYKTYAQSNNINIRMKEFLKNKYKDKGINGLYTGFKPKVYGVIPMRTAFWGTIFATENHIKYNYKNLDKPKIAAIAGICAGLIQTLIDCPLESIKTKLMIKGNITKNNLNFNGFIPHLYRNVIFAASFNYIKNIMKENKLYLSYEIKEKKIKLNIIENFQIGFISGSISSIVTHPLDYVKTKMQENMEYNPKMSMKYIIKNTIKKDYKLFTSGMLARTWITCISMAIGLPIFELVQSTKFI